MALTATSMGCTTVKSSQNVKVKFFGSTKVKLSSEFVSPGSLKLCSNTTAAFNGSALVKRKVLSLSCEKRPENVENENDSSIPLQLPRMVTVESLGEAYKGPFADKYWRQKLKGKERIHPYTVGYKAIKEYKKFTFVQTVREGVDGPEFLVSLGDSEFTGNTPEVSWSLAAQSAGISEVSARKSAKTFYGYESEIIQQLLQPLEPQATEISQEELLLGSDRAPYIQREEETSSSATLESEDDSAMAEEETEFESAGDAGSERIEEDIKESSSNTVSFEASELVLKEPNGTVTEQGMKEETSLPEFSSSESSHGSAADLLLRLRTSMVEGSRFQLPVSWSLYDRLLEVPAFTELKPVLGIEREELEGSTAGGFKSERKEATAVMKVQEDSELLLEEDLGDSGGSVSEESMAAERHSPERENGSPSKIRLKHEAIGAKEEAEQPAMETPNEKEEEKVEESESVAEERGAEVPLTEAPALTPVQFGVSATNGQQTGVLLAAVAGPKSSLLAVLGEDNVFRLLPEGSVVRSFRDLKAESAARSEMEAVLGQSQWDSASDLLPNKNKWKPAEGGTGFQAAGSRKTLSFLGKLLQILSVKRSL